MINNKKISYKRVKPVGLTLLSYNWVIFHIAMDLISVQIQVHPAGIGLNNKTKNQKDMFFPKRKYFVEI